LECTQTQTRLGEKQAIQKQCQEYQIRYDTIR